MARSVGVDRQHRRAATGFPQRLLQRCDVVLPGRRLVLHHNDAPADALFIAAASSIRAESDAEKTYLPRNSLCQSLFPFPLPPSTCADSKTFLRPGIFQSGQVPRVLVSREVLSSLRELPSH